MRRVFIAYRRQNGPWLRMKLRPRRSSRSLLSGVIADIAGCADCSDVCRVFTSTMTIVRLSKAIRSISPAIPRQLLVIGIIPAATRWRFALCSPQRPTRSLVGFMRKSRLIQPVLMRRAVVMVDIPLRMFCGGSCSVQV